MGGMEGMQVGACTQLLVWRGQWRFTESRGGTWHKGREEWQAHHFWKREIGGTLVWDAHRAVAMGENGGHWHGGIEEWDTQNPCQEEVGGSP